MVKSLGVTFMLGYVGLFVAEINDLIMYIINKDIKLNIASHITV